jgi:hypothetical protein
VTPNAEERAHELAESGHAYLAYVPLALAVCTVVVLVGLIVELGHAVRDRSVARPSAVPFAILAPAIFVCQEHFERLVHDGVFPWGAALDRTFVVGLLLQLPFAVAAYAVARLFLRVVRSLGRLMGGPPPAPLPTVFLGSPAARLYVPRVPVLALGYGSRGPPVPSS